MAYLDCNATTPLAPEALEAMLPFLREEYGNASSIHAVGRRARSALDDARDRFAALVGVRPHEIVFTGGGTESDNLGILGLARSRAAESRHVVTAATEHHAVLHAFDYLEKHEGYEVTRLPVDRDGRVDPEDVRRVVRADTSLISVMSANNETGTIQPVAEIARVARESGVAFHSDMVQSFGKLPVELRGLTAASFAGHKFYGPKGVGVLFLEAGVPMTCLHHGGFHENQRRPGTENVAAIVGMVAAAEWVFQDFEAEQRREAVLRDRLWAGIRELTPAAKRNGHPTETLANTLNVSFSGADGETLLIGLDLEGIAVSSGSACMVGSVMPSHVLLAMGVPMEDARATVRFSLGKMTTENDVDAAVSALGRVLERQAVRSV
ncbi:MAG: cysteine desulfurase family protein [Chthoniobacterales bacterium]